MIPYSAIVEGCAERSANPIAISVVPSNALPAIVCAVCNLTATVATAAVPVVF